MSHLNTILGYIDRNKSITYQAPNACKTHWFSTGVLENDNFHLRVSYLVKQLLFLLIEVGNFSTIAYQLFRFKQIAMTMHISKSITYHLL